jgi:predicted permease
MLTFEGCLREMRYSLRQLRRNPIFTLIAIGTLTLGIGANAAIFSVIESVLLHPLPYSQPERLLFAQWGTTKEWVPNVSGTDVLFWKAHSQAFESIGAYEASSGANLAAGSQVHYVKVSAVSDGLFHTFGINLLMGRDFSADETRPGGPHAAIVSYSLWRDMFQGQYGIIGSVIHLNGQAYTLAGVLPQEFEFVAAADVYVPLQLVLDPKDHEQNYSMVARMKDGVTLQQVQDDSIRIFQSFKQEYPDGAMKEWLGIRWIPYREQLTGSIRTPLLILFGAVTLVLLIAVVNLANLFVAQAGARRSEMGVRIALGASRGRLLGQLLTESLMITSLGGIPGLYLAHAGLRYLLAIIPKTNSIDLNTSLLPLSHRITLNGQVLAYSALVMLTAGIATGTVAWLQLARLSPADWARSKSKTETVMHRKLRKSLVVSEIVLSVTLLFSTALLLASFYALRSVKLGFDPRNVWVLEVSLSPEQYKTTADAWTFQSSVSDRLRSLPGVLNVATTSNLPVERGLNFPLQITGCGRIDNLQLRAISSGYFKVMSIPILQGREFHESDGQNSVAIVNDALVRRCWPNQDVLGRAIGKAQIVGVAENTREQALDRSDLPVLYLPHWQVPDFFTKMVHNWFLAVWVIKTRAQMDSRTIQNAISSVDSAEPIASLRPMTQVVTDSNAMAKNAFMKTLLGAFAALALLLAGMGIFGVTSDAVTHRTQEIGVRMALGAQERQILGSVLWEGLQLGLLGSALGVGASLLIGRYLRSILFGVGPANPFVIISVVAGLILLTLAACYIPARRATLVDPMVALRSE